jgi:hypothetical protein
MVKGTWSLFGKGLLILSFLALLLCCWPFKEPVDDSFGPKLKGIFVDAKSQAARPGFGLN